MPVRSEDFTAATAPVFHVRALAGVDLDCQAPRGGSRQAMFNAGVLYSNGRGVARDYTAALTWLLVAKHNGLDPVAEKRIRAQVGKVSPGQISVAEKRALEVQHEIEAVLADPARP